MLDKDKLELLLALCGDVRIPHLEEEIFADNELTYAYMASLYKGCEQEEYFDNNKHDLDTLIYDYSRNVMNARWIEAEHILKDLENGFWWRHYANYFDIT